MKIMTRDEWRIVLQIIVLFLGIISMVATMLCFILGYFIYSSFFFGLWLGIFIASKAFKVG